MPKTATPPKKEVATSKRKKVGEVSVSKRLKPTENKRQVKKIQRFTEVLHKDVKEIVIPKGKGKKLSDIPNVAGLISKRTRNDPLLRTLHNLLLGRVNKKVPLKDNLLSFNGVTFDEDHTRQKLETKLENLTVKTLKQTVAFFGQDPKGKKEELVPRLADFLEKPKASDHVFVIPSEPKKTKKSSSAISKSSKKKTSGGEKKKKKKKDPNAPKRYLSAYFFFLKDRRADLAKKNPKDSVTEIARKLGAAWKETSSSDRKKFEDKSAKDKERYEKEIKSYNAKK